MKRDAVRLPSEVSPWNPNHRLPWRASRSPETSLLQGWRRSNSPCNWIIKHKYMGYTINIRLIRLISINISLISIDKLTPPYIRGKQTSWHRKWSRGKLGNIAIWQKPEDNWAALTYLQGNFLHPTWPRQKTTQKAINWYICYDLTTLQ